VAESINGLNHVAAELQKDFASYAFGVRLAFLGLLQKLVFRYPITKQRSIPCGWVVVFISET